MNIVPVNGHLIIEPVVHESFTASSKETYDEVGIVLAFDNMVPMKVNIGYKVYFDSWLASKFPKGDSFFWLVKWEDVRAIEHEDS